MKHRAALLAAERMADWIESYHRTAHEIVAIELGIAPDGETCPGCLAVSDFRRARAEEKDAAQEG